MLHANPPWNRRKSSLLLPHCAECLGAQGVVLGPRWRSSQRVFCTTYPTAAISVVSVESPIILPQLVLKYTY